LLERKLRAADTDGDRVRAVTVRNLRDNCDEVLRAPYLIDATELGDLLPLTRTEYVTGAEAQSETDELHAPAQARPADMQAFTFCFAMDHLPAEDHTIEKPADYAFWRDYVPQLTPPWTGRLLSLETCHPITLEHRNHRFDPEKETRDKGGLWLYRRIADQTNFAPGTYPSDICLVNWPQNDYWLGNLCDVPEAEASKHLAAARQLSLSLLYWLQTEAPREDGGAGWPGLRLRADVMGTEDGLAKYPYIRESRRIRAEFTVREQHVGKAARLAALGQSGQDLKAVQFPDSVGVGFYRLDLHPSTGGDNYIDVDSLQYQIPLGALIPVRVENLLPACKNLGVTHITNGCYRLHPTEWNIGESAGALAAFCLAKKASPRAVRNTPELLRDFQTELADHGVQLAW
jgi:hypothetical protein